MKKCKCGNAIKSKKFKLCLQCRIRQKYKDITIPELNGRLRFPIPPKILDDIAKYKPETKVKDNKSLYIHGPAGNGKSVFAAKYLLNQIHNSLLAGKHVLGGFVESWRLLEDMRDGIRFGRNGYKDLLTLYQQTLYWLLIDDLGIDSLTDWGFQLFYLIIDYREKHNKPIIITSNVSLDELATRLNDDRISSRLMAMCEVIETKGEDKRCLK